LSPVTPAGRSGAPPPTVCAVAAADVATRARLASCRICRTVYLLAIYQRHQDFDVMHSRYRILKRISVDVGEVREHTDLDAAELVSPPIGTPANQATTRDGNLHVTYALDLNSAKGSRSS
jgi:hypothetical protein